VIGENRAQFQLAPWIILIPSAFLTVTVISINLMGDALRDWLDPRERGGT
jgi:peptide/nickel transport system permease protein